MERYAGLPPLPDRIARLPELAVDLWWSWHPEARAVFRTLDYQLWRVTAHNPVRMLWMLPQATLDRAVNDSTWLALYDAAMAGLDDARAARNTWCAEKYPELTGRSIAYFSADDRPFDRVLLGGVRAAPVAPDLRGRPWRARG
jgi:glycogen phosphorylase